VRLQTPPGFKRDTSRTNNSFCQPSGVRGEALAFWT
jgi:hypothetical protein